MGTSRTAQRIYPSSLEDRRGLRRGQRVATAEGHTLLHPETPLQGGQLDDCKGYRGEPPRLWQCLQGLQERDNKGREDLRRPPPLHPRPCKEYWRQHSRDTRKE